MPTASVDRRLDCRKVVNTEEQAELCGLQNSDLEPLLGPMKENIFLPSKIYILQITQLVANGE